MRIIIILLLILSILLLLGNGGCWDDSIPTVGKVNLVFVVPAGPGFAQIDTQIDFSNINITNLINSLRNSGRQAVIKENSVFLSGVDITYPMGRGYQEKAFVVITASKKKFQRIQIDNEGYTFENTRNTSINQEDSISHYYNIGNLREGDTLHIIFRGITGSIGTSEETTEPVYFTLIAQDNKLLQDKINIVIER